MGTKRTITILISMMMMLVIMIPAVISQTGFELPPVTYKNAARTQGMHPTLFSDTITTAQQGSSIISIEDPNLLFHSTAPLGGSWLINTSGNNLQFKRGLSPTSFIINGATGNANILGGLSIGTASGVVPIGTLQMSGTNLQVYTTSGWVNVGGGGSAGSGTPSFLPKWDATGTNLQDSVISESGGNVGIGTTTPATKLTIEGTGWDGFLSLSDTNSGAVTRISLAANGLLFRNYFAGGTGSTVLFSFRNASDSRLLDILKSGDIVSLGALRLGTVRGNPVAGMIQYTSNGVQVYDGTEWKDISGSVYGDGVQGTIAKWSGSKTLGSSPISVTSANLINIQTALNVGGSISTPGTINADIGQFNNVILGNNHFFYISNEIPPRMCFSGGGSSCGTQIVQCDAPQVTISYLDYSFPSKAACQGWLSLHGCQTICGERTACSGNTLQSCSGGEYVVYNNVVSANLFCDGSGSNWYLSGSCTCDMDPVVNYGKEVVVAGSMYCATFNQVSAPFPPPETIPPPPPPLQE